MTHMLATGVFFSGFMKDLLCLPRPWSPPLQRISRSASAALEYGFPSTHSTNAVSVAMYTVHAVRDSENPIISDNSLLLQILACFYATSIVIGRLYCGMHGFFDVFIGSLLGALIAFIQISTADQFDDWIFNGSFNNILAVTLVVLVLVRVHPEPADDCPCFDDSVAFSGVFIGIQIGAWQLARSQYSATDAFPSTIPFSLNALGWPIIIFRFLLGVFTIFAWRGMAKPTLLRVLPPVFRFIGTLGLLLPRKFFLNASQYNQVPTLRKDDNVIPSASEIPRMLTSLRNPRKRAISIGPQSEADAYEAMAFRERSRRESQSGRSKSPPSRTNLRLTPLSNGEALNGIMKEETRTFPAEDVLDDRDDEELFRKLLKPRVRYDVEVVTKLIVYCGIAYISTEVNPLLFELIGLAPKR